MYSVSADLRPLLTALARLVIVLGAVSVGLVVGAQLIGAGFPPRVLAYVDIAPQQYDLILLDFDHLLRLRKPLQNDVGQLQWTDHRLIVMSPGIEGQWESFDSYTASSRLENRPRYEFGWLWSPDERYLAYAENDPVTGRYSLLIEDTHTGSVDKLAHIQNAGHLPLAWSPDSRRLIYQLQPLTGAASLYLYDPETGMRRPISERASEPVWSPDGQRIMYTYSGTSLFDARIRIYTLATREHHNLLGDDTNHQRKAVWSPDGAWIALTYNNALAVVRDDGTDLHVLTTPFFGFPPQWSPDSRSLIFLGGAGAPVLYQIRDVQAAIASRRASGSAAGQPPTVDSVRILDQLVFGVSPLWKPTTTTVQP